MKKRGLSILLSLAMGVSLLTTAPIAGPALVYAAENTGLVDFSQLDEDDITSITQDNIEDYLNDDLWDWNDYFRLDEDIVLENFVADDYLYSGVFDGNGHTITVSGNCKLQVMVSSGMKFQNLNIVGAATLSSTTAEGLFGTNVKGKILNSTISATLSGGVSGQTGAFAATVASGGLISDCTFSGSYTNVEGSYGAICGTVAAGGTIQDCSWTPGTAGVNGSVADFANSAGTISNCGDPEPEDIYTPVVTVAEGQESFGTVSTEMTENTMAGTKWTITAVAAEGYRLKNLTAADGTVITSDDGTTFQITVTEAQAAYVVNFELKPEAYVPDYSDPDMVDFSSLPESQIVSVTQDNVANVLKDYVSGNYFRLDEDVVVNNWNGNGNYLSKGVFDGNGYSITVNGASGKLSSLQSQVKASVQFQNLTIYGSINLNNYNTYGVFGNNMAGKIINCDIYADITGWTVLNTGAIAGNVSGKVSGCNFYGTFVDANGDASIGGVCATLAGGTLKDCSWTAADCIKNAVADTTGASSGTIENCGPAQEEEPETSNVLFLKNGSTEAVPVEDGQLTLSITDITDYVVSSGVAGTLSVVDYAAEDVIWLLSDEDYDIYQDMPIGVGKYSGELYVKSVGEATLFAYEKASCDAFGEPTEETPVLAQVHVTVTDPDEANGLRLLAGDEILEDGDTIHVSGSEWLELLPQICDADGEWVNVLPSAVTFPESGDSFMAMRNQFMAKTGAAYTITVTGFGQTCSITVIPTYVEIESIEPAYSGTYYLHGRDDYGAFPGLSSGALNDAVTVTPANASNAWNWTMTTADSDIAVFQMGSIVPKKAGSTTLTVSAEESDETVKTGTSTVTFAYLNPLMEAALEAGLPEDYAIRLDDDKVGVELPLYLEGLDALGDYHVSEAGMIWTYSEEGIVQIYRESEVIQLDEPEKYNADGSIPETVDESTYLASSVSNPNYCIRGLKKGIVTVTATPVDTTGEAKPFQFTVFVGTEEELAEQRAADEAERNRLKITAQPENSSAAVGSTVTFTVEAENAVSYQWYYTTNGTKWYKSSVTGNNTASISMKVSNSNMNNQYRCMLTAADGSSLYTDTVCNRMADTRMRITAQPQDWNISDGTNAVFTITAENAASYQWFYSKDEGVTWYKSSLTAVEDEAKSQSQISLKVATSNINTVYRCKIVGLDGSTAYSDTVGVTGLVTIAKQPESVTYEAGIITQFTVETAGAAEEDISYQWYYSKDGNTWYKSNAAGANTNTIRLKMSSSNAGNVYRCKVSSGSITLYTESAGFIR